LISTNVLPQIRVINTSSRCAFRERDTEDYLIIGVYPGEQKNFQNRCKNYIADALTQINLAVSMDCSGDRKMKRIVHSYITNQRCTGNAILARCSPVVFCDA
jgi:hypothetical protein